MTLITGSGQNVSVGGPTWGQGVWVQAEAEEHDQVSSLTLVFSFIYSFTTDGTYTMKQAHGSVLVFQ